MKTPLTILNLWHQGAKTLVSVGGVSFALLLVFMQLGFMGAVSHTATNVLEHLKFDILIRARNYLHLYEPGHIDRKWLSIAHSTPGVIAADPFWITIHNWRKLPTSQETRDQAFQTQYLPIAVMAMEPDADVWQLPEMEEHLRRGTLTQANAVLIDDSTQADYGPLEAGRFSNLDVHRDTEIGGANFVIQGLFRLGTGLAANGAVVTGQAGFARLTPWDVQSNASLGLVQVAGSPQQKMQVLELLRQRAALSGTATAAGSRERSSRSILAASSLNGTPASESGTAVAILSRQEALHRERMRWLWETPIGLIFQLGVCLSLFVGGAIVYMVLATDVANRLPEYATLLAIGYSRGYLASIVMTQAVVLSMLGILVAWGAAEVLYRLTSAYSNIPLSMESGRVFLVCTLGLTMCCISGLLAIRKLWKAEPASLF